MAPTETLETEMARDSHTPPPSCAIDHCPAVDRYITLEGQVNQILEMLNGKGESVGIKGTVDRHERLLSFWGKIGAVVGGSLLVASIGVLASTVAFVSTANKLRAEMHNDSIQQTQIK